VRKAVERETILGQTDPVEHLAGDGEGLPAAGAGVDADGFGNLVANGAHRVERGHRLLEDHADIAAAHPAECRFVEAGEIGARHADRTTPPAAVRQQLHHGKRGHRLAGPGFADDAENAARLERQVDVVQHGVAVNIDFQIGNCEHRHQRPRLNRGSKRSRNPSPIRLRPSTVMMIAKPGNKAMCGASEISVCASASMRPQLGSGGCAPSPT
jgi:hypothetical protein